MLVNLRTLRKEKHLSQDKLGQAIGITQQSINKYETQSTEPDISTLIKLAQYFDTSIDYLVGTTDVRHVIENITPHDLNDKEAMLIDAYRAFSREERDAFISFVDVMTRKRK